MLTPTRASLLVAALGLAAVIAVENTAAHGSATTLPHTPWRFAPQVSTSPPALPALRGASVTHLFASNFSTSYVDNLPGGTSQGDELTVEGPLATAAGNHAGVLEGHEVLTDGAQNAGKLLLTVSSLMPGGQISAQAVIRINAPSTHPIAAAITGGTGRYLLARGEIVITPGPNGSTRLTYLITR
jgi:hypothetical protein